ncbi:protein NUCLEAR FUSION DEFECTIVE 4-like [Canna indica]|uniref:Protein NUCLEAR FUSION DEFECTIVE 4-like n=1 Tax=Canna indica TaxID=4628 RepID=A0AAQ3JTK6_9LILI|nr:protein NUCLEAR FUSION DEFECTIVE 4-like [Canna indica]
MEEVIQVKKGSRPPWVGLAAAVWVQVAAGTAYTFPLYSHSLKSVLGYSQQQLTMLGVANDIGENFGLVAGFVSSRFAPWVVLSAGVACCLFGFGVLWFAVALSLTGLPFWLLWIALCVGTNSSAWLITGVLVTNMKNFPVSRGTVAGILKGYVGLSASVFTGLYTGALGSSSTNLLLFLAVGLPAICAAMMYFVRPCTPSLRENSSERGYFLFTQISSVVLGLYLVGFTILNSYVTLSHGVASVLFGVMLLFLLSPLAIPIKMTLFRDNAAASEPLPEPARSEALAESTRSEPLLGEPLPESDGLDMSEEEMLLAEGEGAISRKKRRPRRGEDFELRQALVKADFWLLFAAFFIGVGSGVTALNNLAQIGAAAGVEDPTILLCLFSFGNFLGRLGGGAVSEHYVRKTMLPRPFWMACTQAIMIAAYVLYALGHKSTLYPTTATLGICYGVQTSVMVPTVSELFGLKRFGTLFNFMLLGNPLGALLFSGLLAGYLYDEEAAKQHPAGSSGTTCLGPSCFKLTFNILALLCSLGTALSMILTMRIRPVYQMLYAGGSFRVPRASGALH